MKKCILLLIIFSLFFSCSKNIEVQDLSLYDGISEIVELDDNNFAFLANLKDYNHIITLGYVNILGEIKQIYPIDKYQNVDVNGDFLKLIKFNKYLLLFYEYRGNEILIKTFNGVTPYNVSSYIRNKNSYGSVFKVGNNKESIYIKSSLIYDSLRHKKYYYNYFILDDDLKELESGVIDLGNYHPTQITLFERYIYYVIDKKLYRKSIDNNIEQSIYKFDYEVLEIKVVENNLVILLSNTIFIVNESGEVIKSFNLVDKESTYTVNSITNVIDNSIVVNLKSEKDNIYKVFTIFGSQTDEYKLQSITAGDSFIYKYKSLIYSTANHLYIKDL